MLNDQIYSLQSQNLNVPCGKKTPTKHKINNDGNKSRVFITLIIPFYMIAFQKNRHPWNLGMDVKSQSCPVTLEGKKKNTGKKSYKNVSRITQICALLKIPVCFITHSYFGTPVTLFWKSSACNYLGRMKRQKIKCKYFKSLQIF